MLRFALPLLTAAATLVAPFPAMADTRLERLTTRQDVFGFEAVGRIDLPEGFCSGALIAPDLVLTAAHCLLDPRTGARINPSEIVFRAGVRDGQAIAERTGARAVVHPAYDPRDEDGMRQLRADLGLIELVQPILAAEAAPFITQAAPGSGGQVSVVSYANGREEAPAWQRACDLVVQGQGVLLMTCDTHFGSSGAPVFSTESGRPRIVSLISRGQREGDETMVWGMEIETPLAETKAALRAGRGVWPDAAQSEPRRLVLGGSAATPSSEGGSTLGGGALNRGSALGGDREIGARFLRP